MPARSDRFETLPDYPLALIPVKKRAMIARGVDVIDLGAGDAAVEAFRAAGFTCQVPKAAMYLWIPLPDGITSQVFADRLMDDDGVIVMPGTGFGASGEGFFRISFIAPPDRLREAAVRAGRVLASFEAVV